MHLNEQADTIKYLSLSVNQTEIAFLAGEHFPILMI